ncbi:MAG: TetR/AcrR family transcriptional regulator [Acidobacteria bacterium]|nr:TetR/AcrR family transcriptional regulator [Acidobacteriota bacterium]
MHIQEEKAVRGPTRRRMRQQQVWDANRRAILDAALELFVADGYAQVSIRNIASKVGYSPGAIYSYFPSKDDIYLALAEEGFRMLGDSQLATPAGPNALDDLAAVAWQLYEFSKNQPHYFALVFLDRQVPQIGPALERFAFMAEIKSHVAGRVQRCLDEGLLPATVHPRTALALLWASVLGIASMALSKRMPPGQQADDLARDAIATTIAGLRAGVATSSGPPRSSCSRP